MDFDTILKKIIEPKLTDMLGKAFAEKMVKTARFASVAETDDRRRLDKFLSVACSDPKFVGMWGTAQAARQKNEWSNLLR